jgi:AraC-like DNA-binding protein
MYCGFGAILAGMAESFKKSYKVQEKDMVSLSVYNVGYQRCEAGYRWGPGVRDHYLIHCVVSGKGHYQSGGVRYDLAAGDVFLVYPYSEVTYWADAREPWEYYWVGFAGSDAGPILEATDFSRANPVITGSAYAKKAKEYFLKIYESRGNAFVNSVEMTGRLYIALTVFLKGARRAESPRRGDLAHVQKGIGFIDSNYSYPISVDEIADYVGISRSQLFREFRQHAGKSPKEYLSELRMRHACNLLKNSSLTVSAIATSVGYDNGMYFSKVFHGIKGMTPTEYRASET